MIGWFKRTAELGRLQELVARYKEAALVADRRATAAQQELAGCRMAHKVAEQRGITERNRLRAQLQAALAAPAAPARPYHDHEIWCVVDGEPVRRYGFKSTEPDWVKALPAEFNVTTEPGPFGSVCVRGAGSGEQFFPTREVAEAAA